jgi:hypothetical protein
MGMQDLISEFAGSIPNVCTLAVRRQQYPTHACRHRVVGVGTSATNGLQVADALQAQHLCLREAAASACV